MQFYPLHFNQLKALALLNLSGGLLLCLPDLIKLPRLEYLETHTTTTSSSAAFFESFENMAQADEVILNRPFMLAMSRSEGVPDTPADASSRVPCILLQQQKEALAARLEQSFGPQDRQNLAKGTKGVHRVLHAAQYFPMRVPDMSIETVYCNAQSRMLANQLMITGADRKSENNSVWASRKVECIHTIGKCKSCHRYRHARS